MKTSIYINPISELVLRVNLKNCLSKMAIASSIFTVSILANTPVQAAQLVIPNTTVLGTNVFSGPSFPITNNFVPSDTLSVNVSGTVDLFSGGFTTNAAGVLVAPPMTINGNIPGQTLNFGTIPFAALLIGNSTLGFSPLFAANSATGLGNSNPPTNLSLINVPLSSIFTDPNFTGIANGSFLEFRINDSDTGNNSGQFVVFTPQPSATPEPSSILSLVSFGVLGILTALKSKP